MATSLGGIGTHRQKYQRRYWCNNWRGDFLRGRRVPHRRHLGILRPQTTRKETSQNPYFLSCPKFIILSTSLRLRVKHECVEVQTPGLYREGRMF